MSTGGAAGGRPRSRGSSWAGLPPLLVAALFAAPFGYLVVRNLQAGEAFWRSFAGTGTLAPLGRSVLLAGTVAVGASLLGTAAAWAVTRTDVHGRRALLVLLPLPLVIPSFIGAFALVAAFAPGGLVEGVLEPLGVEGLPAVDGFPGAFAVLAVLTYPYVYLPVAARLRQLPAALEESARLLGKGAGETFRSVVLPQIRPAILAGALLAFLYTVSDFGAVQLLRYDTLTRVIYANRLLDPGTSLALSLQLALLAIAVILLERAFTGGPAAARGRFGARAFRVPLGRARLLASALLWLLLGLGLLAPVAVLTFWAVRGVAGGAARSSALVTDLGELVQPALNTSLVAMLAAALAVVAVLPVAYLTVRRPSRTAAAANAVVVAGFALPGLVIALSLVFWTLGAPPLAGLYQTLPLLLFAYVVHFGAQSLRAAQVAVAGVPRQMEDAARVLGAGRARRFLRVEAPLMLPGLLAGGGLVLLSTMKELPATLLLAPAGFQTLATKIWTATEDAFLADASLAALVLVAVSGVLTWLLVVRQGDAWQ